MQLLKHSFIYVSVYMKSTWLTTKYIIPEVSECQYLLIVRMLKTCSCCLSFFCATYSITRNFVVTGGKEMPVCSNSKIIFMIYKTGNSKTTCITQVSAFCIFKITLLLQTVFVVLLRSQKHINRQSFTKKEKKSAATLTVDLAWNDSVLFWILSQEAEYTNQNNSLQNVLKIHYKNL